MLSYRIHLTLNLLEKIHEIFFNKKNDPVYPLSGYFRSGSARLSQ